MCGFRIFIICILIIGFAVANNCEEFLNSTVRGKRQNPSFKCTLPQYPAHGHWIVINGDGKPGDQIDINTILRLECNDEYRLNPNIPFVPCDNYWNPENFPKCEKMCPPFYSSVTTTLKCIDRNGGKIPCDQAIDGTYLTFSCVAYYEVPVGSKRSLFCREGSWDFPKPVCQPVCGKKINNKTLVLSYGGRDVKDLEYPWVVAIYRKDDKFTNICGGTLVSRRIVLTAAHCVSNNYGTVMPKENYEVAAGKYYNAYNDSRDEWVQYRKIAKLIVHEGYRGESQRFVADIAIIVVRELFLLGPVVQPVCINNIQSIYLRNHQMGEIAGWGLTEKNSEADRLRVIKIPFKDKATCSQELPTDWEEKYNFFDKICAGFFRRNISVCKGDSGSGLIFKNPEDSRYYIHGIVSIAPNLFNAQCNYETDALHTNVSFYFGFVDLEMHKHYLEDCVLPPHPINGKWTLENDLEKNPGDIVRSTTILKFTCDRGYKVSAANVYQECESTINPTTCNLLCPEPDFPSTTIVNCRNRKEKSIDCGDSTHGSSITYTCPTGFATDKGVQTSTRYCISGTYGNPRPDCILEGTVIKPLKHTTETPPQPTVNNGTKVICTYARWRHYNSLNTEILDPTLCTHVVYDFISLRTFVYRLVDEDLDFKGKQRGLSDRISDMKKKNKNLKVLLSVGGDGLTYATLINDINSSLFSEISKDAAKIEKFVGSAGYFIKTYHFDGIDIDWQVPEEADKQNYISFLQTVSDEFDRNGWLLSASVRSSYEGTGYNVTAMNKILDWVSIKSYDFYSGDFSTHTGFHNALYATSKGNDWEKNHLSMEAVAKNWIRAGLSKEKLVLSIAFYGRIFKIKDKNEHGVMAPITGAGSASNGQSGGFIRYYELCELKNWSEEWDEETKSVYKYDDKYWIGFNNKDAVRARGEYIKKNGFGGVNVYPWDGDDNEGICGTKHILLKHVHRGMGQSVDIR